jgi:hypothetical protein
MNKEDIWVASVPVPVNEKAGAAVDDVFEHTDGQDALQKWNIYSPLLAPVRMGKTPGGKRCLVLRDADKFDYAKAERLFPVTQKMDVEFSVTPAQADKGKLHIELQDAKGTAAVRLIFDTDGEFRTKAGARYKNMMRYHANEKYDVRISFQTGKRSYAVYVNQKEVGKYLFFAPVETLERIVFRTGEPRYFPTPDTPADQTYDVKDAGESDLLAEFYIHSLKTK